MCRLMHIPEQQQRWLGRGGLDLNPLGADLAQDVILVAQTQQIPMQMPQRSIRLAFPVEKFAALEGFDQTGPGNRGTHLWSTERRELRHERQPAVFDRSTEVTFVVGKVCKRSRGS